jgi:hypothetical protein
MPKSPGEADQGCGAGRLMASDDRSHRDYVIPIGRVTHAELENRAPGR